MLIDPALVAQSVSMETGLPFTGKRLPGSGNEPVIELTPTGYSTGQTFVLRTTVRWRSLVVRFEPGAFAADLVRAMGQADRSGRAAFGAVLTASLEAGSEIELRVNGDPVDWADEKLWQRPWTSVELELKKGQLPLQAEGAETDRALICEWTGRVAAAVVALLPLEATEAVEPEVIGFPEGDVVTVLANRYERDRRNRAAALAIHGYACRACGIVLSDVYGEAAAGFIEVHHLTLVSVLGPGYIIDPKTDLAPLCPNCHGMAHRRTPPFSISELQAMLGRPSSRAASGQES